MVYQKLIVYIVIVFATITIFSILTHDGEKKVCPDYCEDRDGYHGCLMGCGYLNLVAWMTKYKTYSIIWLAFVAFVLHIISKRH